MNLLTSKQSIQATLQVIAVSLMLWGAIRVSQTVIGFVGSRRIMTDMQEFALSSTSITGPGSLTTLVASSIMPLIWGAILFNLAPLIAKRIQDGQAV